uniref:Lipocalin/cytosolic fatty-acid binding domain-containing protein n=2 Tax=Lotharella globosa TaxID=91324 RepID=A0A7S3YRF3_9EUKA
MDKDPPFDMMTGNAQFQTEKYLGTWYEVASMKKGFAGQGQEDCHCTQGMYLLDRERNRIVVNTFCAHGGPDGRISGIQGVVKCLDKMDEDPSMMREVFVEQCKLRFPSIPIIPAEPYDIIATDYTTFSLVQGASDKSFVQIYSRKPNPGAAFIEQKKELLKKRGFDTNEIVDTYQDCDNGMVGQMMDKMMAKEMSVAPKNPEPLMMKSPKSKLDGPLAIDSDLAGPKFLLTEARDLAKLIAETVVESVFTKR